MVRLLYSLLLYLATPLIGLRLWLRSRKQPDYRRHWAERWGCYRTRRPEKPLIWVHAVSVGETRAAEPLIRGLQAAYPEYQILLTAMTPTGRETGSQVYGPAVIQAYLPYDYPDAVARFLHAFQPAFGVLMETEIWPNLLAAAKARGVPVFLANARLSERSARGYQRFGALSLPAFAHLTAIAAQTQEDAARLAACGAPAPVVCGNLKFDVLPSPEKLALGQQWRQAWQGRPCWLAASTREGEESLVLAAFAKLRAPETLLVLVPRHPQRFDEVAQLIASAGLPYIRRSEGLPGPEHRVWLGDSMGEMVAYYAAADLAFIGGSLLPLGGQNLIEAAACACPVVVGPHTFNFAQATRDSVAAGAAIQLDDPAELAGAVERLLADPQALAKMAASAQGFARAHQGATGRTLAMIRASWSPAAR